MEEYLKTVKTSVLIRELQAACILYTEALENKKENNRKFKRMRSDIGLFRYELYRRFPTRIIPSHEYPATCLLVYHPKNTMEEPKDARFTGYGLDYIQIQIIDDEPIINAFPENVKIKYLERDEKLI